MQLPQVSVVRSTARRDLQQCQQHEGENKKECPVGHSFFNRQMALAVISGWHLLATNWISFCVVLSILWKSEARSSIGRIILLFLSSFASHVNYCWELKCFKLHSVSKRQLLQCSICNHSRHIRGFFFSGSESCMSGWLYSYTNIDAISLMRSLFCFSNSDKSASSWISLSLSCFSIFVVLYYKGNSLFISG